jgi:hypothetical protein
MSASNSFHLQAKLPIARPGTSPSCNEDAIAGKFLNSADDHQELCETVVGDKDVPACIIHGYPLHDRELAVTSTSATPGAAFLIILAQSRGGKMETRWNRRSE